MHNMNYLVFRHWDAQAMMNMHAYHELPCIPTPCFMQPKAASAATCCPQLGQWQHTVQVHCAGLPLWGSALLRSEASGAAILLTWAELPANTQFTSEVLPQNARRAAVKKSSMELHTPTLHETRKQFQSEAIPGEVM
jgi:hypothetical protein